MAKRHRAAAAAVLAVLVVCFAMLVEVSSAQGFCNVTQDGLKACKPACSTGSKGAVKPSDACCSALTHADLTCLCAYKDSPLLPYFGIDPTLAMALPSKCNLAASDHC